MAIAASDAGLLDSGVGSGRTSLDADAVADEFVAGTAAALGTDEEQVREGEVLSECQADSEAEDELGAGPGGAEGYVLVIMVDDETSETVNASVVATDAFRRGVGDF